MRPIDADRLIARLEDDAKHMEMPLAKMFTYAAITDIEREPTITIFSHWIPVTERLPDKDGRYLVTTSKGQTQVHVFNQNGNSEEYWTRCNKAWMEMPEPFNG